MEEKGWNKVLLSVFRKSLFLRTEIIDRRSLKDGANLLEDINGWDTKVLVKKMDDESLVTSKFDLHLGEKKHISEYLIGQYSSQSGWSNMYFRLDGHTRPFVVVSVINDWYDTNYYKTFDVAPEMLEAGEDISPLLDQNECHDFPDLKLRYVDGDSIEVELDGKKQILDGKKYGEFVTPSRHVCSRAITVYGDKHSIDERVRVKIEVIPAG